GGAHHLEEIRLIRRRDRNTRERDPSQLPPQRRARCMPASTGGAALCGGLLCIQERRTPDVACRVATRRGKDMTAPIAQKPANSGSERVFHQALASNMHGVEERTRQR